jgi:hypothetical protein
VLVSITCEYRKFVILSGPIPSEVGQYWFMLADDFSSLAMMVLQFLITVQSDFIIKMSKPTWSITTNHSSSPSSLIS